MFLRCHLNRGPVRSVAWAEGGQRFATVSHPFMESNGFIFVYDTPDGAEPSEFETIASLEIPIPNKEKVSVCLLVLLHTTNHTLYYIIHYM
jgi:hypothetical protein